MANLTPWGEPFTDLAEAVSADADAPPVLALAAFKFRHGDESNLRSLVDAAYALHLSEGGTEMMRPAFPRKHYGAPCWEQPGKQEWHLGCALAHPVAFLRSRGPVRWRRG